MSSPKFSPMPQQLTHIDELPSNIVIGPAIEPKLVYVREETLEALRQYTADVCQIATLRHTGDFNDEEALLEFMKLADKICDERHGSVPSNTEEPKP